MIFIFIPGVPKSTQTGSIVRVFRKTASGKKMLTFPKRLHTEWSTYVRLVMQEHRPDEPLDGALMVSLTFCMPKLASGKRARPIKRPDLDNLLKGFLDSGNGILWHDDAQVCHLDVHKVYADAPGVEIKIEQLV